jgi:hypothetical protein
MAAKIIVEADDSAQATMLGVIIASAIQQAGLSNTACKNVMVTRDITNITAVAPGFGRVSSLNVEVGIAQDNEVGEIMPPVLDPLYFMAPANLGDWVDAIEKKTPGTKVKPVVLSIHKDTCPEYEADETAFLAGNKSLNVSTGN